MNVMNKKIDEASDNRQPTWSVGSIGVIQIYSIFVNKTVWKVGIQLTMLTLSMTKPYSTSFTIDFRCRY